MSDTKDGGPAFPQEMSRVDDDGKVISHSTRQVGMTLRAYFAAKAMQGIHASPFGPYKDQVAEIAALAVRQADALIAALERQQPEPKGPRELQYPCSRCGSPDHVEESGWVCPPKKAEPRAEGGA